MKTEYQASDSMNPWITMCAGIGVLAVCWGLPFLVKRGKEKQLKLNEARRAEQLRGRVNVDSFNVQALPARVEMDQLPQHSTGTTGNTGTRSREDDSSFGTSVAVSALTGSTALGFMAGGSLVGAALGSQLIHHAEASPTSASNNWRDTGSSCAPDDSLQALSPIASGWGSDWGSDD